MLIDQIIAKKMNAYITEEKFNDKNLDEYIYASLSQPPIRILDKKGSNDEMDFIVECPNCHSAVCYGTSTYMYSGHIYCNTKGCREKLIKKMQKEIKKYAIQNY